MLNIAHFIAKIRRNTLRYCALLAFASLHTAAHAQIFKCKDASGNTAYQDAPCATEADQKPRKIPVPGQKNESFAQPKRNNDLDGNWNPNRAASPSSPSSPTPALASAQPYAANPPANAPTGTSWQDRERDFKMRQAEQQEKAAKDQAQAFNRMQRCSRARQTLGVLREARPVYRYGSNGEKNYVKDEDREAEVNSAQQRVNAECN